MFRRNRHVEEEEGESVFVSMTDLTVSMLMIVIVLLGFFASQMKDVRTIEELERTKVELGETLSSLEQSETLAEDTLANLSQAESEVDRLEQLLDAALRERTEYRVLSEERAQIIASRDMSLQQAAENEQRLVETLKAVTTERDDALGVGQDLRNTLLKRDAQIEAQAAEITRRIGVESALTNEIERLTILSETQSLNVDNLQQALTETSDELAKTNSQLEDTNKAKEALESELEEAGLIILSLNGLIEETKAALSQAQQVNQAQTSLLETVFAERDAALAMIENLSDAAETDSATIASLENMVDAANRSNAEATKRISDLSNLVSGLKDDLASVVRAKNAEIAELVGIREELTAKSDALTIQVAQLETQLQNLEKEGARLASALDASRAEQASTLADLRELMDEAERLKLSGSDQTAELNALKIDLQTANSRISNLQQEVEAEKTRSEALRATLATTEASLAIANQTRDAVQSSAEERQLQLDAAMAELKEQTTRAAQIEAALEATENRLSEVGQSLASKDAELAATQANLADALSQADTLVLQLEDSVQDREALQRVVEELNSQSSQLNDALVVSREVSENRRLEILLLKNARRNDQQTLSSTNRVLQQQFTFVEELRDEITALTEAAQQAQQEIESLREKSEATPVIQVPQTIIELCDVPEQSGFDELLACINNLSEATTQPTTADAVEN